MSTVDVFKLAHQMEVNGMDFYKQQKDLVKDPALKTLFNELQDMEKDHATYLKKQIDNIEKGVSLDDLPVAHETQFHDRLAQQKIDTKALASDLGDFSIIRMAYLIEKDFKEYYAKAAKKSSGKEKDILHMLSAWESNHAHVMKVRLEAIIDRNSMELGFYPFD